MRNLELPWKFHEILDKYKSVQFSRSVVSDSLQTHESYHSRPPCPSPPPGVYSNSCPSSRWCHPAISLSVSPSSCPQSLPASGSFPMSQLFAWGGESTGVSASASVLQIYKYLRSYQHKCTSWGFSGGSDSKESACNVGELGSIPGLGRSPGRGHRNPLQYSCLENPHGQRSCWATVHGVA